MSDVLKECNKCKGRMLQICNGTSGLPFHIMNKYRVGWGIAPMELDVFSEIFNNLPIDIQKKSILLPNKELVGSALKKRIEGITFIKSGKGCGCNTLAKNMDLWGIKGCIENKNTILDALVGNKEILVESLKEEGLLKHVTGIAINLLPDLVLRTVAEILLNQAIDDVKKENDQKKTINKSPKIRKLGNRGKSSIVMPLSVEQTRLYRLAINAKKPTPDPFKNLPVVHFGAHLWPVKGNWEWHVEKWNELVEHIEGRCIVVVVTDKSTADIKNVREKLSDKFEVYEEVNTPQGENPSFRKLQDLIPSGQDDILIYCHGKGVREHTANSESVRLWTEMMYETVIFNYNEAINKFKDGYKAFGSFRTFGDMPLSPKNRWHYSGTFFIVRAKYLLGASVKNGYGGVEAWLGDHIVAEDVWCEFSDNTPFKTGYDINAMYPSIVDAQMQWEVDKIKGFRCEQHKRELQWFLGYLKEKDKVLVIGSKHGGLEYQIKQHYKSIETLSVDIEPQTDNTQPMIVGSSADHNIQLEVLRRGPFDVVFIDGDHTYQGVEKDWLFAKQMNPRLIIFHDIADATKHRREGCEVDKLWQEIKLQYITTEKIVGCGWGGIGVVHYKIKKPKQ